MKKQNEQIQPIKRPRLVLNNATKLYLASKEISTENDDCFFIMSMFLPKNQKRGDLQTELMVFDDAESASIYGQALEKYSNFNVKYLSDMPNVEIIKAAIDKFNQIER